MVLVEVVDVVLVVDDVVDVVLVVTVIIGTTPCTTVPGWFGRPHQSPVSTHDPFWIW